MLIVISTVLVSIVTIIIGYFKWQYTYWWRRKVNYLEPHFPWGSMQNPMKINQGVSIQNLYNEMRRKKWKHAGIYVLTNPNYLLADPELIKKILVKDFQSFTDRGMYYNEDVEPIGAHLFAIGGKKWAKLRSKFSPTFTSSKMKMMFKTMLDCEKNLKEKMAEEYINGAPIDIKNIVACFTTDIIGSCAFGVDCNTFKTPNSDFRKYGNEIFELDNIKRIKFLCMFNFPKLCDILRMKIFSDKLSEFFSQVVAETINYREANNNVRNDFMQLLIELKNKKDDGESLTMNEMIAHCFVFFAGGFETSATTLTFALYELAKNPDVQDRLRSEIETVLKKYEGEVTYDGVKEMTYLQQVINETLRKYPPVPHITRQSLRDYEVPEDNLKLEKGTIVTISILGLHYDEKYFPNPNKFDPERFNAENSKNRVPYTYMPFGDGPRTCIGLRFGLLQIKIGLISLLRNYKFSLDKTMKENLVFKAESFVLAADGGVFLNIKPV